MDDEDSETQSYESDEAEEDMEHEGTIEEDNDDEEDPEGSGDHKVFLPGQSLEGDEERQLVHDRSAYHMYYAAQTGAPCLSFDVLRDSLGDSRQEYPMTAYIAAGTQAEKGKQNFLMLMKMYDLNSTFKEADEEEDSDEDDEQLDDEEPQLDIIRIQHPAPVNRIRVAPLSSVTLVASWSETGKVHLWDVTKHVVLLDSPASGVGGASAASLNGHKETPLHTFNGHKVEGFAMDWSPTVPGRLVTGDCKGKIHLWNTSEKNSWSVEPRPFTGHTDSVEDIQWSPNEETVFGSCSVDKTIRIWDIRAKPNKACMITTQAHETDVNVIHWNRNEPFIVSGGDDGIVKVWDLRQIQKGSSVGVFKHHTRPVTSVEWHPTDSSVFASAGADDQIVQWDLAVEKDEETAVEQQQSTEQALENIPPQLLFIHQGQEDIKELHWHPQLVGVVISTAHSGLNIFKTISV